MTGFPYDVMVELTLDGVGVGAPTWQDITPYVEGFTTKRGRASDTAVCDPGTLTVTLDNSDGRFDPANTASPYYPFLVPNRRVRVSAMQTAFTSRLFLARGYVDRWAHSWPGGGSYSQSVVDCTDRFKLLALRTITGGRSAEKADARVTAILNAAGVPLGEYSVNPGGYNSRSLFSHPYKKDNALDALQETVMSDGGLAFVSGDAFVVYQTTRYRLDDIRATSSNGVFGTYPSTAVPVQEGLQPAVDDQLMSNLVRITDGHGKEWIEQDATAQAAYGLLELDLGSTLLLAADAQDRAADLLAARKDARARVDSITLDALTSDAAMTQALNREISDRITVGLLSPGTSGTHSTRDYFIESVEHDVQMGASPSWTTTFGVSG